MATPLRSPDELRVLRLIFRDEITLAPWRRRARDLRQDIRWRGVEDLLRRVQPQAIEVKSSIR